MAAAASIIVFLLAATALAGAPSFQGIGVDSIVYEVAGDGSLVVGRYNGSNAGFWTPALGWTDFGFTGFAYSASADGSVIAGWTGGSSSNIISNEAFRWTQATGTVILPAPSNQALEVSADGSTIVGVHGSTSSNRHPFRHVEGVGTIDMSSIPDMPSTAEARGVSGDGSRIVGIGGQTPWLWDSSDNSITFLTTSDGGLLAPLALSADGTTAVGGYAYGLQIGAGFWRDGMITTIAPEIPSGIPAARDVSADGSIITGYYYPASTGEQTAWIWDESNGLREVKDYLEQDFGIDLTGWRLRWSHISDDGMTLAGYGWNPDGDPESWIATIPEPSSVLMLLAMAGCVGSLTRRCRRRYDAFHAEVRHPDVCRL